MKAALVLPLIPIALTLSLVEPGVSAADPREQREAARAEKWKVPEIFAALGVRGGQTVADIGCGDGFLTLRLAAAVGGQGKVIAVDIDAPSLARLKARVEESGTKNVEMVRSSEADPQLAPGSLDGAVVLRAYHEFTHYKEMLAKIREALRPRARLVIADVGPAGNGEGGRDAQVPRHVLAAGIVQDELTEAGFRIVLAVPSFTRLENNETVWLIAAEAPPRT